ncbi:Serine/threonine-protein kinase/endoribonuclease IRE1a, partial [Cucurbita argyrosperma subsp. argyrosperma]
MKDMVAGLVHLHELGIIHRDLKPQNVLIIKKKSICAKLSDMGISKHLSADMSSLGHRCGSSGWQAPEQLLQGRQTRAVDLFSLGCVLFFCITGGRHPFGDRLERDINIVKNQMNLFLVESIPEALDLISQLLNPNPCLRPKASEVLHHPFFWSSEMRLSFLHDTSDRIELEDRETNLMKALENTAQLAIGTKWDEKMEPAFIANIGWYRRYKYDSVRDLLRVMRNKLNHYRELPKEIQELIGSVPEGFDGYFASRFPRLLIEVYKVISQYCRQEECFQKYFKSPTEIEIERFAQKIQVLLSNACCIGATFERRISLERASRLIHILEKVPKSYRAEVDPPQIWRLVISPFSDSRRIAVDMSTAKGESRWKACWYNVPSSNDN